MNFVELADQIIQISKDRQRFIVAIAGPPGAGKTTFATALQTRLPDSKIVPMDGFHLDNVTLSSNGSLKRKGAPETFDSDGFVNLIERLARNDGDVEIPFFDRDRDLVIADADLVSKDDAILIVEGNYLLINALPWSRLSALWDRTIFINPGIDILEERLIERWIDQGFEREQAKERARSNDIPNAHYVIENSFKANIQVG